MDNSNLAESVPGDEGSTLTDIITAYAREGFDASFGATPDGQLECGSCHTHLDPSEVAMSSLRRLEGASDPDDMLAVVALTCPECGSRGTVALGYGPASAAEDSDILRALRDRRGDDDLPAHMAPGETSDDAPPVAR
jgi:hypothetical protein